MRIRKATLKDKKFVKELDKENMQPLIETTGQKYSGHMFDRFNSKDCLIIEDKDKLVGFLYFEIIGKKLHIFSIQIKRKFQQKGYGNKLMGHIITFAKEKKLKKIILEAHDSNKQAINFYKNLKFKIKWIKKNKIGFEYNIK